MDFLPIGRSWSGRKRGTGRTLLSMFSARESNGMWEPNLLFVMNAVAKGRTVFVIPRRPLSKGSFVATMILFAVKIGAPRTWPEIRGRVPLSMECVSRFVVPAVIFNSAAVLFVANSYPSNPFPIRRLSKQ